MYLECSLKKLDLEISETEEEIDTRLTDMEMENIKNVRGTKK